MTPEKRSPETELCDEAYHQSKLARYEACNDALDLSADSASHSFGAASGFCEAPQHSLAVHTDYQEQQSEEQHLYSEDHVPANKPVRPSHCSKFRGVEWDKQINRWRARITIRGKKISLGSFTVEEDAARAYNEALSIKGGPMQHFNQGLGDLDTSHIPYVRIGPSCLHEAARQQVLKLLQTASMAEMQPPPYQPEVLDDDKHGDFKTSPYRGVSWDRRERKWRARITINKKHKGIGRFNSPEEAARAYDKALLLIYGTHGQRNFPWVSEEEVLAFPVPPSDFLSQLESSGRSKSSCFHGVSRADQDGRWRARITINGKLKHLGVFESEEEAARQYDAAVRALASTPHAVKYQLNFPEEEIPALPHFLETMGLGDGLYAAAEDDLHNMNESTQDPNAIRSQYRGLYWDKKDRKWRVRIHINGRQQHVGRFTDEFQAAQAYDKAAVYLLGPNIQTNFGIASAVVDPAELPAHIVAAKAKLEAEGVLPTKAMYAAELAQQRKTASNSCSELSNERVSLSGGYMPSYTGRHCGADVNGARAPVHHSISYSNTYSSKSHHEYQGNQCNDAAAMDDQDDQRCVGYSLNLPLQPLTAEVTASMRTVHHRHSSGYVGSENAQLAGCEGKPAEASPFSSADAVNTLLPAIPKAGVMFPGQGHGNGYSGQHRASSRQYVQWNSRGEQTLAHADTSMEHSNSLKHQYSSIHSHMSGGMQPQLSSKVSSRGHYPGENSIPREGLQTSSTELSNLPPLSLRVSSLNTITTGDCVVRCGGADVKKYPSAATMEEIKKYANFSLNDLRKFNGSEQKPYDSGEHANFSSLPGSYQATSYQDMLPCLALLQEATEINTSVGEPCFTFDSYGGRDKPGQLELVDLPPQEVARRPMYNPSSLYHRSPSPLSPREDARQQHTANCVSKEKQVYHTGATENQLPSAFGHGHSSFLMELTQPVDIEADHKMHMIMTTSTDVTDIPLGYSAYHSLLPAHVA